VRLLVVDRPGVMAQITKVFGEHGISLRAVTQHESAGQPDGDNVPVMVLTHVAREGRMGEALDQIARLEVVKARPVMIRLVEEHVEYAA